MNICMCLHKHMHVSSVACVLVMIMNDPLIMIAYLCLIVLHLGCHPCMFRPRQYWRILL